MHHQPDHPDPEPTDETDDRTRWTRHRVTRRLHSGRATPAARARIATAVGVLAVLAGLVLADLTAGLAGLRAAVRRGLERMRATPEAGLTSVEVAIITAVLLGLATALTAAITAVVNRNTSKIK